MAGIVAKSVTVATATTRVQVQAQPAAIASIMFEYDQDNTAGAEVYIGGSDVSATVKAFHLDGVVTHSTRKIEFPAGNPGNIRDFWVDSDTNGSVVNVLAVTV